MDILFVTQVVLDRPHGAPRHVLAVARAWAQLGHRVTLLAPGADPPEPGVLRVRPRWVQTPGARLEAALAEKTAELLLQNRPQVAYVRLSASSSLVPAVLAAARVPFVVELNGRLLDELSALGRGPLAVAAVRQSARWVVARARALVAVEARIGRHAALELGAQTIHVIENGADLQRATPGDRGEARQRLRLPGGPILVFVGTLVPEQRFDLLFAARRSLAVPLYLVGDGPQKARVLAEAATDSEVHYVGQVTPQTAIDWIRAATVCVNVRQGDLGMKCLEYAAVGRRLVTFQEEGAERLAGLYDSDLEAVHLVEPADLASGLAAAMKSEANLGPLPPDAVEKARAQIGWEHTAARILAVLERL